MHTVGNMNMDDNAYKKFVSLSKEQQRKKLFNAMKPVNMDAVEKALKGVPHGNNISGGNDKEARKGQIAITEGNGKNLPAKS